MEDQDHTSTTTLVFFVLRRSWYHLEDDNNYERSRSDLPTRLRRLVASHLTIPGCERVWVSRLVHRLAWDPPVPP